MVKSDERRGGMEEGMEWWGEGVVEMEEWGVMGGGMEGDSDGVEREWSEGGREWRGVTEGGCGVV